MAVRLSTVAPDVVLLLDGLAPTRLWAVAQGACELAMADVGLADARIDDALNSLRDRRVGDSVERDVLKMLVDDLDEHAWELQEAAEAGGATQEDYLKAFRRARAASAVWFALDADAQHAAAESLYEAHAALGNLAELRRRVQESLE